MSCRPEAIRCWFAPVASGYPLRDHVRVIPMADLDSLTLFPLAFFIWGLPCKMYIMMYKYRNELPIKVS